MEEIDPETGLKIRKLTELKQSAAAEYQESMLKRVEHFSQQRDTTFNSFVENTVVGGLKFLLDLKIKLDDMLGENKDKVYDAVEKLLLFGL